MSMLEKLSARLFALWYPLAMHYTEIYGQQETRHRLVGQAYGRTLEIGAGSGYNLAHYTSAVTELIVSEPSPFMLRLLERKLTASAPPVGSWQLEQAGAERLPYPDDSFDTVVGTLVHCTIPDSAAAMREINRVLRPGGQYLFLEHVRARPGTARGRIQDLLVGPHRWICAGCYPNRDTESTLAASPLAVEVLEHGTMPRAPFTLRPTIVGKANAGQANAVAA